MFEFLKDKPNELLRPKPILGKDLPLRIYPPYPKDYILIGGPPTKSDTPVPDIAFGGQDHRRMLLDAIENNRNTSQRKNGERKMRENAYHDLKILPGYFDAVKNGTKTFELRKGDRDYRVDDMLLLSKWSPESGYCGNMLMTRIVYILKNAPGLEPGYVVLGISSTSISVNRKECIEAGLIKEKL